MLLDGIKSDWLKCQHTDHCQRLERFVLKLRSLSGRLRKAVSLEYDVDATTRNE
jgi:hypothetical protein